MVCYLVIDSRTSDPGRFCVFIIILYGVVLVDEVKDMAHRVDTAQVDYERGTNINE